MRLAVAIAENDGVAVQTVINRGLTDLKLRIAYRINESEKK